MVKRSRPALPITPAPGTAPVDLGISAALARLIDLSQIRGAAREELLLGLGWLDLAGSLPEEHAAAGRGVVRLVDLALGGVMAGRPAAVALSAALTVADANRSSARAGVLAGELGALLAQHRTPAESAFRAALGPRIADTLAYDRSREELRRCGLWPAPWSGSTGIPPELPPSPAPAGTVPAPAAAKRDTTPPVSGGSL